MLRSTLTQKDYEAAIAQMGPLSTPFFRASFGEAVAYFKFMQKCGDQSAWVGLGKEGRNALLPEGAPEHSLAFIRDCNVCLHGFMVDVFEKRDSAVPMLEKMPIVVVQAMQQHNATAATFQEHMERIYLSPFPKEKIELNAHLHYGHLIHGLVSLCRKAFTRIEWTCCIAIVDASSTVSVAFYRQQQFADLMFIILSSPHHWALMVLHNREKTARLYDGKSNHVCRTQAENWLESLNQGFTLQLAQVPEQVDEWSCGHRVLLSAKYVIGFAFQNPDRIEVPEVVPDSFFVVENITGLTTLIQTNLKLPLKTESDQVSRKRIKTETPSIPPPAATAEEALVPANISEDRRAEVLAAAKARAAQRLQEVRGPAGPSTPQRKSRRADLFDVGRESGEEEDKVVQRKPTRKKAAEIEKETAIRKTLEENGLDHNCVFQKRHCREKVPPNRGHWKEFISSLVKGAPLKCPTCSSLAHEYFFAPDPPQDPQAQPTPADHADPDDAHPPEPDMPDVLPSRKRGRPVKGAKMEGYLYKWLEMNRPGIYRPLEDSETSLEYYCVPCRKKLYFSRDASTYVELHEKQSTAHSKGLQAMGLSIRGEAISSRGACDGAIVSGTKTLLGGISKTVEKWVNAGQPLALSDSKNGRSVAQLASWRVEGMQDQILVRSVHCVGEAAVSGQGCYHCRSLLENKSLAKELAGWGFKLDLASLAYATAYGSSDEVRRLQEMMVQSDYWEQKLSGHDMEEWLKLQGGGFIFAVRRLIESCTKKRRNSSFEALIQVQLSGLAEYSIGDMNKNMFSSLMTKYQDALLQGSVLEEDRFVIFCIIL